MAETIMPMVRNDPWSRYGKEYDGLTRHSASGYHPEGGREFNNNG